MRPGLSAIFFVLSWTAPSVALAESCRIQNASAAGLWKFIRAYDPETGHVVLRQAVNGQDSKPATVTGSTIRVEYKLAGHTHYHSAKVVTCKGGNTVSI